MRPITLNQFAQRTDLELDVLFDICSAQIQQSEPYDTPWLAATMTAAHIIRLRSIRSQLGTRKVA